MGKNSQSLLLNSSNVVPSTDNTKYEYMFKTPISLTNKEIAVANLSMYYSWANLDKDLYNNVNFAYRWFDTSGNLTQLNTITIPDGNYNVDSINLFIQAYMVSKGHYTLDSQNKQRYFISVRENPSYYTVEFVIDPMFSKSQAGTGNNVIYRTGDTRWAFPTTPTTPQILFPSTSNFNKILGFDKGVYYPTNPQSTTAKPNSVFVPEIDPASSIVMVCNMVNSEYSTPNTLLFSFSQGSVPYGSLFELKPSTLLFSPIMNSNYQSLSIQLFDQNFKPVKIKDPQISLTLVIQDRE
jgi:hypothetical protein